MRIPALARALPLAMAAQWCACAQEQFTVAVFNYSTPRPVAGAAVETAWRAFHSAGVESRWVLCEPDRCPSELAAGDAYLEIFVMPRMRAPLPGHGASHPAGYAMATGFLHPRAYVFLDAARDIADCTTRPLEVVLGSILIHEIGHLLGLEHQPSGVMRAHLDRADMDGATMGRAFTAQQSKELHERLSFLTAFRPGR